MTSKSPFTSEVSSMLNLAKQVKKAAGNNDYLDYGMQYKSI
jgi:hypothetical protein